MTNIKTLKLFIFTDPSFCYGAITIAKNKNQAIRIFKEKDIITENTLPEDIKAIEKKEITEGFIFEAGGNG